MRLCSPKYSWISLLMATLLFSITPVVISRYRNRIGSAVTFNGLRALFALPVAFGLALLEPPVNVYSVLKGLPYSILSSLAPLGDAAYVASIKELGSSKAALVTYTYIFIAQPVAALVGEELGVGLVIGAFLAFAGVTVGAGGRGEVGRGSLRRGLALAVLTALLWGFSIPFIRYALRFMELSTLFLVRLVVVWILLAPPIGRRYTAMLKDSGVLKALLITGTVGWGLGMPLFMYSVECLGASAATIGTALVPVLATLLSRFGGRERVSAATLIGASLVAAGIAIAVLLR